MKDPAPLPVTSPKDVAQSFKLRDLTFERVETPSLTIRVPSNVSFFELAVASLVLALRSYVSHYSLTFVGVKNMSDPKTTITALVTGIAGILSYFGVLIPEAWLQPIILIGVVILGWLAADKKTEAPK